MTASRNRALMLGLDGLSRAFMESPFVKERMPNLIALLADSSTGPLTSTIPPYTAPAWTTITTGLRPGRHGVYGFTDSKGTPVSDAQVVVPRLWDHVGAAGGRSIVLNVPLTYPARPIEGLLASGMPAASTDGWAHPTGLAQQLHDLSGGYVVDEAVIGNPKLEHAATRLTQMTVKRGRAAAALAAREPWDLFAIVFVLPDRLGHPWWKHLVPDTDLYHSTTADRSRALLGPALSALDNAVADLMSAVPGDTTTVLCSDHGFGPLRADIFFDVALAEEGLIEGGRRPGLRRMASAAGRTPLARLVPRSVIERAKRDVGASSDRRAWTAPKYDGAVRLADPGDEALRARVVDLLEGLRGPGGEQVVASVHNGNELFAGEYASASGELYPEMASEDLELHEGLHADRFWVSRENEAWGTHRSEGVVAVHGSPALPPRTVGAVEDVAPTVLAAMGLEVPDLDGHSLIDRDGPLTRVEAPRRESTQPAYDEDQEAAVMEHLRGLGYVE